VVGRPTPAMTLVDRGWPAASSMTLVERGWRPGDHHTERSPALFSVVAGRPCLTQGPYPPSIFGMKKTSAPGGTGWK
jgi:hypothetical protein